VATCAPEGTHVYEQLIEGNINGNRVRAAVNLTLTNTLVDNEPHVL